MKVIACAMCGMHRIWGRPCHYCRLFTKLVK